MQKKKKLMNYRPVLIAVLFVMLSSIIATLFCVASKTKLIVAFCLLGLFLILTTLSIIFNKKALIVSACVIFLSSFVFFNLYFRASSLDENLKYNEQKVFISGTICENVHYTTSGNLAITLSEVSILSYNDNENISGRVKIYTQANKFDNSKLVVGQKIEAFGTLNFKSISSDLDKYVGNFAKGDIAGGFISYENIKILDECNKTLSNSVKNGVLNVLNKTGVKNPEVGYAMMFGDTSFIDSDIKNIFQTTGIAHLLAVSGLHISIIAFVINFILSRFKVSKKVNFVTLSILLLFYCYLCDFSVSVVRASLMSILLLYASVRGKPYDRLSGLSLVAILLLLINPLYIFSYSFILSFVAVASIYLLSKPFERVFDKVVYRKMASSLGLNFAVQFGLFAFSIYLFGKFEVLGLLCNLISVPIATIAFVIMIISVIIVAVLPFMSFLLNSYGFLMDLIIKFNYAVSRMGWTVRFGTLSAGVLVLSLVLMFLLSDYVFVSRKTKAISSCVPLSLIAVFVFI